MIASRRCTTGSETQFPGKLHKMLKFAEENDLESIISWELNGHGFKINDPDRLVSVLPFFFGQTKYRSFRRQLNMWHFHRILEGPYMGIFIHPYFVRQDRTLCAQMNRSIPFNPNMQQIQGFVTKALYGGLEMKRETTQPKKEGPPVAIKASSLVFAKEENPLQKLELRIDCDVPSCHKNDKTSESFQVSSRHMLPGLNSSILSMINTTLDHTAMNYSYTTMLSNTESLISNKEDNQSQKHEQKGGKKEEEFEHASVEIGTLDDFSLNILDQEELNDGDAVSFEGKSFFFTDHPMT